MRRVNGTSNWGGWAIAVVVVALLALVQGCAGTMGAAPLQAVSDKTVPGFKFPESVAYDPEAKVLYVSVFGSELNPTLKDGKGKISKVSLTGEVLEDQFLPLPGETMNKPKGLWVKGNRLWVTDIDSIWSFDLKSKKSRRVELPGIKFANDPAVMGDGVYISDNRGDFVYAVYPADFLEFGGEPRITQVMSDKGLNPNGLYPAQDGSLLIVGFKNDKEPKGIYSMQIGDDPKPLSPDIGRLDGIYQLKDGSLLATDWNSGSLFQWKAGSEMKTLAKDFKGPADFCVVPSADGMLVVVPDLVKGELRFVQLK